MRALPRLTLVVSLFLFTALPQISLANGLDNLGFESGLTSWTTDSEADIVTVVGSEGPADAATYADQNLTVDPYIGSSMLRLGSVTNVNEQQNRGDNIVSQTFEATTSSVQFSLRLFSWEHRGDDEFGFDLKDSSGNSGFNIAGGLSISMVRGGSLTCSTTPCNMVIDAGKRGDFVDSGWRKVEITGLTPGNFYTLSYRTFGGQNEAHGTWAYFDNANTPPVAVFTYSQAVASFSIGADEVIEGDPVTFIDKSYDPDPGDQIVSWEWTVSGPHFDDTIIVSEQNPIFVFPEEGDYEVTLTVTDSYGATDSITTNAVATDGTLIPALIVQNEPPLVGALSQEVLAGEEVELLGRIADPGFLDTHSASWGGDIAATADVMVENIPAIATGIVTGLYTTAPNLVQTLEGILTVTDDGGATANDSFELVVLDENFPTREPNDTLADAPALPSGWVYLSSIDSLNDIDIFEVTTPDGGALEAGSEVLVKLKNLPADYDVILLSEIPGSSSTSPWLRSPWLRSPFQTTPWLRSPWLRSPWLRSPWLRSPWLRSPWLRSPWLRSPWLRSPWLRSPWLRSDTGALLMSLDQIPLSEMAYAVSEGEGIGGTDLDLSELGLEALSTVDGISVAGFSANRGLVEEEILVRTEFPGTKIYVVVKSNNGAFTPEPYSLQIETSRPFDIVSFLGDACNGSPLVANAPETIIGNINGSTRTLFVTQKERMQAIYGNDAWDDLSAKLQQVSAHASVNGAVLSVNSGIYDYWDSNPCDIEAVNSVSTSIRDRIGQILVANPLIEYVVIVGSDNIAPHRRVPDETAISNERLYAFDSLLEPGSPIFISNYFGYNLTDDYFVDNNPLTWQGRELYVPKVTNARLVETPAEIINTIDAFLTNNGQLNPATAFVTGTDFFKDGAQVSADAMAASGMATQTLISDEWDAEDIRCQLLGNSNAGVGCGTNDFNAFNTHFSHFGAISAYGFFNEIYDDIITSAEVAEADTFGPGLFGAVFTSLGCHAGLNVPDGTALTDDFGDGIDPNLDFAQAMAQQGATFAASTGYGLGDDTGLAGTERLMALYSEELAMGGSLGHALRNAKTTYVNTVNKFTVYDEKSTIQTTLYGMPMYQITPSGSLVSTALASAGSVAGTFELNIDDGGSVNTTSHTLEEVVTADGTYYNASGDHQATAWRAIQPKVAIDVSGTQPVHGVLMTGASYTSLHDVDPVISIMTQEWQQNTGEEAICLNAFWPSTLASINTLEVLNGFQQSLIVLPGQFRCTSGNDPVVTGTQRLYSSLDVTLLRSGSNDFNDPTINEVEFRDNGDGSIRITVDATDASGISQIVMLVDVNGTAYSISGNTSGASPYSIDVPNFIQGSNILIQVVDNNGNVARWSGKGADVHNIGVDAGDEQVFDVFTPTYLTATIYDFVDLLDESNSVFYRWNFGDESYDFGRLAKGGDVAPFVTLDQQTGHATFTVQHQYTVPNDYIASLKIMDAFGGMGTDEVLMRLCGDAADLPGNPNLDLVGCSASNSDATNFSILLQVAGEIVDGMQFRLYIDHSGKGNSDEPDGKADEFLKYSAGSATGMSSLTVDLVDLDGNPANYEAARFNFDLSEVRWRGQSFNWWAETQDGVSGEQGVGHADVMPNSGSFLYTAQ